MVSAVRLPPPLQYALQDTRLYIGLCQVFRYVGETQSCDGCIQHWCRAIEDQLPFDADFQFAAALLELPDIQPAVRGQAQIDTAVSCEILRSLWNRMLVEVRRSAHDRHPQIRSDADGDHVLRHLAARSHAGVKTLGDDVR